MKKILIFGMPRSGTTFLQIDLVRVFKCTSYKEPFTDQVYRNSIGDPYEWAKNLSSGVVKVLAQDLDYVDLLKLINIGQFDSVIVTQRKNIADICISLYYAEQLTGIYHYDYQPVLSDIVPFKVTRQFIDDFLVIYKYYVDMLKQIKIQQIPHTVFDYDLYLAGEVQIIQNTEFSLAKQSNVIGMPVRSNILYSQVCLNYTEVSEIIANEIDY